ncbi:MAG: ABC transporter substrate-binding protein, partial [Firmicutes bacterium]|nr:ABC transporter substrate-binding protein [Bacillota bacterium]
MRYPVRKRPSALVAVLALAALVLAACTGGSGAQPTGQQEAGSNQQASSSEDTTQSQGPVTLVWGRGADSSSLDPINVTDGESIKVTNQ